MTPARGISLLAQYALRFTPESERIHVYDAIASLAQHVAPSDCDAILALAENAAKTADQLRAAHDAQLEFVKLINPEDGE